MTITILSDIHIDYWVRVPNEEHLLKFMKLVFGQGDVIVIAGDISENPKMTIMFLKLLKKHFYKYVVCVFGNHDYYVHGDEKYEYSSSIKKVERIRLAIKGLKDVHCLNGNIVEIEGIRFGGADGWYDGSFNRNYFHEPMNKIHDSETWVHDNNKKGYSIYKFDSQNPSSDESINELWHHNMPDPKYLHGIKNYNDIFKIEKPKIEAVYKECDVMVTHVNPSYLKEHLSMPWQENINNGFYSFDGLDYLQNGSMKYWVFGHTHDSYKFKHEGVKCIVNALGMPSEKKIKLKQIYI